MLTKTQAAVLKELIASTAGLGDKMDFSEAEKARFNSGRMSNDDWQKAVRESVGPYGCVQLKLMDLVDDNTEELVATKEGEEWRDIAADMIREGKDFEAWKVLLNHSSTYLHQLSVRLKIFEDVFVAVGALMQNGHVDIRKMPVDNNYLVALRKLQLEYDRVYMILEAIKDMR